MTLSLSALTVIVLANVVVTIALWLESARQPPQPKLKKKFIKQLLPFSSKPITPKHQPPKARDLSPDAQRFFDDFADFANIINEGLERWSAWRLQELPETEHRLFGRLTSVDRSYAVFYNQTRVGELAIEPDPYRGDRLHVATYIHLTYARL